jgi:hypothetical protein
MFKAGDKPTKGVNGQSLPSPYRTLDCSLDYKVYHNPTTVTSTWNPYHNTTLPTDRQSSPIDTQSQTFCDQKNFHNELEFPQPYFRKNRYSQKQINQALNPKMTKRPGKKTILVMFLPYIQTMCSHTTKVHTWHRRVFTAPPLCNTQLP